MSIRPSWLIVLFKSMSLLIWGLLVLSVTDRELWKYLTISVDFSVVKFLSCFASWILKLCYKVHKCLGFFSYLWFDPFIIMKWLYSLCSSCSEIYVEINLATFFRLVLTWYVFFYLLLSIYLCLYILNTFLVGSI